MHLGLVQYPVLCERLRRQVKLHPLQVEAQTGADGFDEALLQGLDGKGRNPISCMQKMMICVYACVFMCGMVCVYVVEGVLAKKKHHLKPQQMGVCAHMFIRVHTKEGHCVSVCVCVCVSSQNRPCTTTNKPQ